VGAEGARASGVILIAAAIWMLALRDL